MKFLIMFLCLGVLTACSSVQDKRSLSERIQAEEVRSLQEIKSHSEFLLKDHKELDERTKNELSVLLNATMIRHQALRDEESKIFQLLLSKSLRINQLTDSEIKEKNSLKIRLKNVYEEKSNNVLALINKIVDLSEQKVINDSFRHDMIDFIREFR
jgi:hypothetical protein